MDPNKKLIPLELHPMGFIECFMKLGAKLEPLLENTGINQAMLGVRGIKISYVQQSQLIRNGIGLCRSSGIGLKVGQIMDWSFNGTVGLAVSCAPSLMEAGAAMRRYLLIAQPHYAMYAYQPTAYVDENGMLVMTMESRAAQLGELEDMMARFELEYRLAVTLRLFGECGYPEAADTSIRVKLAFPRPAHYHMYESLPCDSVEFNADVSSISAHVEFLTTPWRQFRKPNFERVTAICESELKAAKIEPTLASKVRWHVSLYYNKLVTLEEIADLLSMTPRALTRKLACEGTSFRAIMHDVRMELTAFHLRSSKLNVDEIAEVMGFSSASSLRRAIKNWSGETVGAIRAESASASQ
ncbi:helix-turn-helix domain-containing protein [Aurantivibrio plasticivorans]